MSETQEAPAPGGVGTIAPEPTGTEPTADVAASAGPPPGPPGSGGWAPPRYGPGPGARGFARSAILAWAVAGVLLLAVVGLSVGLATSGGGPVGFVAPGVPGPGRAFGPNPAAPPDRPAMPVPGGRRGAVGIVTSVSFGSFTMRAIGGQTLTVDEPPSTIYASPSGSASASSVVQGALVAVQGTRNGTTITATRVIVLGQRGGAGGP
jgi:hypothetical protein